MPNVDQPYYGQKPLAATCDGIAWCVCDDPDVDLLGALISTGLTQSQASRLVWGLPVDASEIRPWVRAQFQRTFPWLRIPMTEGGVR